MHSDHTEKCSRYDPSVSVRLSVPTNRRGQVASHLLSRSYSDVHVHLGTLVVDGFLIPMLQLVRQDPLHQMFRSVCCP